MPINPDFDLKKVPLQAAVAYLISLHDNEVDWNLLGIKVIGVIDALPIPAGTYEYGDAYMVGTETPYDMYIYTRPDGKVHTEGYWFPVGKFPMPGQQGPKGDGIGQVQLFQEGITTNLTYDSTNGGKNESISSMTYKDSTTGQRLTQNFQMVSRLPIIPGKYVSIDATSDNKKMEVKVDDKALALDYYKIQKGSNANVPAYSPTNGVIALPYSYQNLASSLVRRGLEGEIKFTYGIFSRWNDMDSGNILYFSDIFAQIGNTRGAYFVSPTLTNTGTFNAIELQYLQTRPQYQIQYGKQIYYRMDPLNAPDGTLNYIHIDSIDDGNGGYKATGKLFSVKVSTRVWKVFELDFGGSTRTTHNLCITDNVSKSKIYFQLINNRTKVYTTDGAESLLQAVKGKSIPCTVEKQEADTSSTFHAGIIQEDTGHFKVSYGETTPQALPFPANLQIIIEDKLS